MTFNDIILWSVAIGVVIGGVDKLLGNKFGIGGKFDEGFQAMGDLTLAVAGIVVLAPVLANWMQPFLVSLFGLMHADPSMFASIIANDMGGYSLAMSLAQDQEVGLMAGCITSSMLGCTLVFSLPVGLGLIEKEDKGYFCQGLLIGLVTVPVGSIIGGMAAGFAPSKVLINNIPIIILAAILAIGLKIAPDAMNKGTGAFGTFIGWLAGGDRNYPWSIYPLDRCYSAFAGRCGHYYGRYGDCGQYRNRSLWYSSHIGAFDKVTEQGTGIFWKIFRNRFYFCRWIGILSCEFGTGLWND